MAARRCGRGQVARDREVVGQAVGGAVADVEAAGHEEREVGRHRARAPVVRRVVRRAAYADQASAGHHLLRLRHGDVEVHPGLVERVVVGREPPRRHVGLVEADRLGARRPPSCSRRPRRRGPGVRRTRPGPGRRCPPRSGGAARSVSSWRDGRLKVDRAGREVHRPHRQQEVEVEGAQPLGGAQRERGPAPQPPAGEAGRRRGRRRSGRRCRRCRPRGSRGRRCRARRRRRRRRRPADAADPLTSRARAARRTAARVSTAATYRE